jgi:hypothetical protein
VPLVDVEVLVPLVEFGMLESIIDNPRRQLLCPGSAGTLVNDEAFVELDGNDFIG